MKPLPILFKRQDNFSKAVLLALFVGAITSLGVLAMRPSHIYVLWLAAEFLGDQGNDLFLIGSNLLIIIWACRRRLWSVIKLTLALDLSVWLLVQGLKILQITPWYLRPNGGLGGFPSGHATHAFAMAFLLTLYFPRFAGFWYACAAAISWSRVETYWHSGFQVAAGIILGIGLVWYLAARWLQYPEAAVIKTEGTVVISRKMEMPHSCAAE